MPADSQDAVLAALAALVVLGAGAQWLSWKTRLPAILFLLLVGVVVGPVAGLLDPDALFGPLLFPVVSLGVAVILFEGSLTLRVHELRGVSTLIRRLVTVGAALTWAVAAGAARVFAGLDWGLSALFGALVVVTGPTVIVPLLRTVRPRAPVATALRWEGILIDPVGALLAVLVYEFLATRAQADAQAWGPVLLTFLGVVGAGALLGGAAGYALGALLRRRALADFLINTVVLAAVLATFTASNLLAHESGLLAVTVMGIVMANMRDVPLDDVLDFKETLTLLVVSALFILLAARMDLGALRELGWGALAVVAAIQFVAQPLKAWVCAAGTGLGWREKLMLAWIGPRGIVAAAVSGLFALRLQEAGVPGAGLLVPLTFTVIVGTVVFASTTARAAARVLDMAEPEDRGVLIVGANRLTRELAKVLDAQGFPTLIADSDYTGIRAARMDGLATWFGNPVSSEADRKLELVGIGKLLAMSRHPELNALAAVHYRRELGAANVYVLLTRRETEGADRERIAAAVQGRVLFGVDVAHETLLERLDAGARISATRLTETFGWDSYRERLAGRGHLLFGVSPRGVLHVAGPAFTATPGPDWVLIGLHPPPEDEAARQNRADEGAHPQTA